MSKFNPRTILASVVLLLWFSGSLYVGVAGLIYGEHKRDFNSIVSANTDAQDKIIYDGITFTSEYKLKVYISANKINYVFRWLDQMPELLILVMTSCAMGAFGGLIRVVRQITFESKPLHETKYISLPFMGLLLGMIVLGISYLLPTVITANKDIEISEASLIFFSLFAGLFSESFMKWLDTRFQLFINKKQENE